MEPFGCRPGAPLYHGAIRGGKVGAAEPRPPRDGGSFTSEEYKMTWFCLVLFGCPWFCLVLLGFAWSYSSESGLFNGLWPKKINLFLPRLGRPSERCVDPDHQKPIAQISAFGK
jgi:hypothetical protein